jgi:hypothetical protein
MFLKLLRWPFKSQISCHSYNIPSMSPSRVGGPILLTNSPREQKKNKVNVCSILINKKKNYNLGSSDSMVFGYVFYF